MDITTLNLILYKLDPIRSIGLHDSLPKDDVEMKIFNIDSITSKLLYY